MLDVFFCHFICPTNQNVERRASTETSTDGRERKFFASNFIFFSISCQSIANPCGRLSDFCLLQRLLFICFCVFSIPLFLQQKTTCPFSRNICLQLSGHNDRLEFGQKLKRSDLINTCGLLKRNHQPSFIYLGYCALEWPCQS